jgi:hypothetical protein
VALSATYTPEMLELLEEWMEAPQRVMLCEETVSLKVGSRTDSLVATALNNHHPI